MSSPTPATAHAHPAGSRSNVPRGSNPRANARPIPTAGSQPSSRAVDVGSARATRISSADSSASRSTSAKERRAGASGDPTVVAIDHAAATSRHIRRSRAWTESPTASTLAMRILRRGSGAGSTARAAIALSIRAPPSTALTTCDACRSPCFARWSQARVGVTPASSNTATRRTVSATCAVMTPPLYGGDRRGRALGGRERRCDGYRRGRGSRE